ncbi:MAG: phosphoribosylformylglycinamidine cyclo-ligase [Dehalococcoidia bacterium]
MAADARATEPSQSAPRYAAAGVDISANDRLIPRFQALAEGATRPEVLGGVGPFSGLFDLSSYQAPLLVASTDGVGTKVLIARAVGRFDGVGEDLVNHCINDILTAGARPLFFLDYLANNGLSEDQKVDLVRGVARACRSAGMALLGGETADMPDLYRPGDFDLAGTIVGVVEKGRQIDGSGIAAGDALLALPSSGLHTNGYSLVRAIFGLHGDDPGRDAETLLTASVGLAESLADALLQPHLAYWPALETVLPRCKGIAHITGGGVPGNLARVLPPGTAARVRRGTWPQPPVFELLQRRGDVSDDEMFRVFNMGVGLILVVATDDVRDVQASLPNTSLIGEIVPESDQPRVQIVPPDH